MRVHLSEARIGNRLREMRAGPPRLITEYCEGRIFGMPVHCPGTAMLENIIGTVEAVVHGLLNGHVLARE